MKNTRRPFLILLIVMIQLLGGTPAIAAPVVSPDSRAFITKGPPIPPQSMYAPWVATRRSKTPTFNTSWCENTSQTASYYTIRYRMGGDSPWSDWITRTTDIYADFVGTPGRTYYFRARATNRDGAVLWSKVRQTIVPYDDRQLVHKKFGFRGEYENPNSWFYRGTVTYSMTEGDAIVYKFRGKSISLISTLGPGRSKAKIYIDNKHRKTIDTYSARQQWRHAVFTAVFQDNDAHYLKIVNLGTPGRPRFDVDGLAVGR